MCGAPSIVREVCRGDSGLPRFIAASRRPRHVKRQIRPHFFLLLELIL